MKPSSPRACPKCGSLAVARLEGEWRCSRGGCGHHSAKPFPYLRNLHKGKVDPQHRWQYGVGPGGPSIHADREQVLVRESKVEGYFCQRVDETGGIQRKAQWIGRRGCPDRWCGWPQRAGVPFPRHAHGCWVELKKPATPNAAAHQAREHARMRECGQQVYVLASIEDVDNFILNQTGFGPGQGVSHGQV